ncbi:hypothetical protein LOTGIDRAFT_209027 [Lottia gigantea]|uniref:Uncharacterized protein n=1 Tax=Lottia gigantea TaxID=225164 RepID=V4AWH8_LOTGI|nr:hypothetical protein LOTGIDRAFT_209027 [Lottia gigantea]ESO97861.1 hypothetical protein LOTGIDRAFT_209027 [Lottia gigantea]
MTTGSEVLRYQLCSKNVLAPDETELYELTQLAGVVTDPQVFKIILDLLKLNVAPAAILHMIKSMSGPTRRTKTASGKPQAAKPESSNIPSHKHRQPPARSRDVRK